MRIQVGHRSQGPQQGHGWSSSTRASRARPRWPTTTRRFASEPTSRSSAASSTICSPTTRSRRSTSRPTPTRRFSSDDRTHSRTACSPGYNADKRSYDPSSWGYQKDKDGFALVDETMRAPALRLPDHEEALLALHAGDRAKVCGTPKDSFLKVCEMIATTVGAGSRHDHHVRAGLDAALARVADDPHRRRWCNCCSGTSAFPAAA